MVRAPDACTNRRSWMPAHVLFVVAAAMAVCTASPGWGQATPTPAALPTATAGTVRITIGSALAGPGDPVQLTVSIDTAGASVAATGNDITFDTHVLRLELSACRVNPAIGKSLIASVVRTDPMTTTVRVLVRSTQNTDLIPDGPLYTCTFRISPSALPGTHRLQNQLAIAFTPAGAALGKVVGVDGSVTVSLIGRSCTGDCSGDGSVTVGTSVAASPGALVRNNIVEGNGIRTEPPLENIKVFTTPRSDLGYDEDFDLVFPATFLPPNRAGRHDILREASFNFPSDGDFRLRPDSPAIDAGATLPLEFERVLFTRTTTGTDPDSGPLDLGFHDLP